MKYHYKTPIDYLIVTLDKNYLLLRASFEKNSKGTKHIPEGEILDALHYYFSKKESISQELISKEMMGTLFQKAVWQEIAKIPFGKTVTYKDVAEKVGRPKAYRAVGTACGKNEIALFIPCHRVVASDGSLSSYAWGIDRKKWLLEHEGVFVSR